MGTPEVARDAFSYNEEAERLVITVKPVGHAWRVYSKTALKATCLRTRQRHAKKNSKLRKSRGKTRSSRMPSPRSPY